MSGDGKDVAGSLFGGGGYAGRAAIIRRVAGATGR